MTAAPTLGLSGAMAAAPRAISPAIGVNVGYALRQDVASANLAAFERIIGRPVDYVVEYGAQAIWKEAITSAAHALRVWRSVTAERPRKLLWNQPLTMTQTPLSEVAAGRNDTSFEIIATNIRNAGFPDAIINLGWDMTGGWVPWSAHAGAQQAYIDAYRRIATVFKKVSPAFRMCWSPARHAQEISPADVYPGDAHVDLIGMSVIVVAPPVGPELPDYVDNVVIGHGLTPVPGKQPYSLAWLAEFARLHGKHIVLPEVAVGVEIKPGQPAESARPLDDDVIVTRLAEWISRNDVVLHCWRDLPSSEGSALHSRISRSSPIAGEKPANPADERPRLSTAYRKAWGGRG